MEVAVSAAEQEIEVLTIAAMARDAEWLNADACAFLLGMTTPGGKINRRGESAVAGPSSPCIPA